MRAHMSDAELEGAQPALGGLVGPRLAEPVAREVEPTKRHVAASPRFRFGWANIGEPHVVSWMKPRLPLARSLCPVAARGGGAARVDECDDRLEAFRAELTAAYCEGVQRGQRL